MPHISRSRVAAALVTAATAAALTAAPAAAQGGDGQGGKVQGGKGRGNVDGALVIGSLAPETGELSTIVQSLRVPVELAVQEINGAGGVNGAPVTLVNGDDGSAPDAAKASLDQLLATANIDAIVGPSSSPNALAVLRKIRSSRVLTCSGSNTAADLSKVDSGGYYFRTSPPDRLQGRALAELIRSEGHEKIGILARDDSYGADFAASITRALVTTGAKVVANVQYDPDGTAFDREVEKVAKLKPDAVVVVALDDDGAKVVQAMIAHGIGPADTPVYTVDGMQSVRFAGAVDPADPAKAAGIKGTLPAYAPADIESPFLATFATTGTDAIYSAYYYDCTILIALAAEKAKSDDPAKMRKAFARNLTGDKGCDTYAACKKLLGKGKTIHWRGASSRFDEFDTFEPGEGVYDVWSYDAAGKVQIEDSSAQIRVR